MTTQPYLSPEDVSAADAKLVLDFLNAATSAREIADRVEIAGELDVGVRIAQRLLDRRAQLGGTFTDLHQVRSIPLVGPERFTEIVITLSHAVRPTALTDVQRLAAEVDALRRMLLARAPGAGRRVALRALQPRLFLGQAVSLVAQVTEALDGGAVVDAAVTFVATWGRLRVSDGYAVAEGGAVTARTGVDGLVRLTLLPPTSEPFSQVQQDAVTRNLALLDPDADSPGATVQGFQEMAREYAWEVNVPFRQAVDILVKDFRPALLDAVAPTDPLAAWRHVDGAVLAFAPVEASPDGDASPVAATATLGLRFRDWLAPFLQSYLELASQDAPLAGAFDALKQSTQDPSALLNGIYGRAGAYIGRLRGSVGAYIGQKVAQRSIRSFLETGIQDLPVDARASISPALDVASKTIAATSAGAVQGLLTMRQDFQKAIDVRVGSVGGTSGVLGQLAGISGRLDALVTQMQDVPTRSELATALAAKVDGATFTAFQSDVSTSLATKVDTATFTAFQSAVSTSLATKVDTGTFQTFQGDVNTALATKVDAGTFQTFQSTVNAGLAAKVDTTEFNRVNAGIDARFTSLDTRLSAINVNVGTISTNLGNLSTNVGNLSTNLGNLQTRVNRLPGV